MAVRSKQQQTTRAEMVSADPGTSVATRLVAHTFWSAKTSGQMPSLPPYAVFGLETAVKQFDEVNFWHFEPVSNVPEHVTLRDAAELLPIDERDALRLKKVSVEHISDIVRFRAAAHYGGWIIDADNIWLRAPPVGFVFSTLYAKREGGVAQKNAAWQTMKAAFAKVGWDGGDVINLPCSVVANTPFSRGLRNITDDFVRKSIAGAPWADPPTQKQWNQLMHTLRDLILKFDLGEFVRPPIEYGPSPFWGQFTDLIAREGWFHSLPSQRRLFGVQLPSAEEILTRSYCVPTSFLLASRHDNPFANTDMAQFALCHPRSLLGQTIMAAMTPVSSLPVTSATHVPIAELAKVTDQLRKRTAENDRLRAELELVKQQLVAVAEDAVPQQEMQTAEVPPALLLSGPPPPMPTSCNQLRWHLGGAEGVRGNGVAQEVYDLAVEAGSLLVRTEAEAKELEVSCRHCASSEASPSNAVVALSRTHPSMPRRI